MAGFIADVKAWQTIVRTDIRDISYRDSFISTGKFIFSKYIPGKFWIIIGKAGYLREKYKNSFINLASYSFYYQLIALFAGTVTGIGIIYFVNETWFWVLLIIASCLLFVSTLKKPSQIWFNSEYIMLDPNGGSVKI